MSDGGEACAGCPGYAALFLSLCVCLTAPVAASQSLEALQRLPGAVSSEAPAISAAWRIEKLPYDTRIPAIGVVAIRAGFLAESPEVPFAGNILYLQGLGDSMMNHGPLFSRLAQAGYRVIAFDYMGQGGSGGSMNHTQVLNDWFPALQISAIGELVWERMRRPDSNRKIVLGWSTGGLAAYELARRNAADAVILIAPGIHPKLIVGERLRITKASLTRADYSKEKDPHVNPIRPDSPAKVPVFASNLVATSLLARHWTIPESVKGLVLLSGPEDTYVDGEKTMATLASKAPHFKAVVYERGLHELDNEVEAIRESLIAEVLAFLENAAPGSAASR